jgi:hypothetical protein
MRTYRVMFSRPGGEMNEWPGFKVTSPWRGRAVAVILFRKWFGLEPTCSWFLDGYGGEATDKRGNCAWVDQEEVGPKCPHCHRRHHVMPDVLNCRCTNCGGWFHPNFLTTVQAEDGPIAVCPTCHPFTPRLLAEKCEAA